MCILKPFYTGNGKAKSQKWETGCAAPASAPGQREAKDRDAAGPLVAVPELEGPAVVLRYLLAEGQADARAVGLRGVEGDEEVRGLRDSRPVVLDADLGDPLGDPPGDLHPPGLLVQRGLDGVLDQVYDRLLDLRLVGRELDVGPGRDLDLHASLERGGAPQERGQVEGRGLGRRQPREAGVALEKALEALGPRRDNSEARHHVLLPVRRPRLALDGRLQRGGDRLYRGERVVELVAQDADEALPRLHLLLAQGPADVAEHQELVRPPVLAERPSPHAPAPVGAGGLGRAQDTVGLPLQAVGEADLPRAPPDEALTRLAEQALAGGVDEAQPRVRVEREDGDIDLLHHGGEERSGLKGPAPLRLEDVAQPVDLGQDVAQGVAHPGSPRAEREVALAQRKEEVGHGLQGAHDALPRGGREPEPAPDYHQGHGAPHVGPVVATPDPREREGHGGRAREKGVGEDRLVVVEVPRPLGHESTMAVPKKIYSPYFSRRR